MSPSAEPVRRAERVEWNVMTKRNARHSAGFTLVELLVALAIFMLIMGSLAMLLSGSISTVNQSYAMMNAMERARGSMAVLETDLKTAFASSDKREFFQFYGEPNGFMYSGQLVNGGFGRVTYAVHTDNSTPPMQGTGGFETVTLVLPWGSVAEQFTRVLLPGDAARNVKPNVDKDGDGIGDVTIAGLDASVTDADFVAGVFSFRAYTIRVFSNLCLLYHLGAPPADYDAPVEFTLHIQRGVLLRYEERGQGTLTEFSDKTMSDIFAPAVETNVTPSPFGRGASALSTLSESDRERMDQLQQGHYWVRMLTGNLPLNGVVDPFITSDPLRPRPFFWTEDNGTGGKRWRDYVVTEGILVGAELIDPTSNQPIMGRDSAMNETVSINALDMSSFFSFGLEDGSDRKSFNTLWNMPAVSLPEDTAGTLVRPMFDYFLYGTPANPVSGDAAALADAMQVQVYGYSTGDPLKPRLPAWVAPGFWIFGDPPRTGAPSFHQWFQQKVDIPSAYLRDSTGT